MPHARQQIRDAAVAAVTGLTTAGSNVYKSRAYQVNKDDLPALKVYSLGDTLNEESSAMGDKRGKVMVLMIQALARPTDDADDLIDTMCAEVEAAIFADPTLGGLVKDLDLGGTEIEIGDEAENQTGSAEMTFACLYRIDRTDPTTIID